MRIFTRLVSLFIVAAAPAGASGDESLFREQVSSIFASHCVGCHNDSTPKGDFSIQTAASFFQDGHIEPGDAAASYLIELISATENDPPAMPKAGPPLSHEQVEIIEKWIDSGAEWPAGFVIEQNRTINFDWWSLNKLEDIPVPRFDDGDARQWINTPIDAFVLNTLRERGLQPSSLADRRTLIRRLSYDLTGLPPSFEEIEAFVNNPQPDAYEKLVDRLLASPRYGERWAQHWLDVVKYADTCGYDKDKLRLNAWPYRDYVIRSLNEDKPYKRFVEEQIAGDVLYPDSPDGILGLGFIAAGPWDFIGHVEVPESKIDGKVARNLDRDDMVSNTLNTFCSVTIQCARCHDHKFDPFTQQHYYGLQAVFAAVDRAERVYDVNPDVDPQLEPPGKMVYAAATDFPPEGEFKPTLGKPRKVCLLVRGDVEHPGDPAAPGLLPLSIDDKYTLAPEEAASEGARRAALAHWITRTDHPLTWRSIVNRVWHYHFGRGIVDTPNDFGRMGGAPSHPELLDWLAAEFRDNGGSLKSLHRLIVTSSVYQQSSFAGKNSQGMEQDSANRLLWKMNRRRLSAEEIRDSILLASGQLSAKMGGPGYYLFELEKTEHSPHYEYQKFDHLDPDSYRRSIYRFVVRSQPDPYMTTLDCADSSQSTPSRMETQTPLQSLAMLNSDFNLVMAEKFAGRLSAEADTADEQIQRALRLAVGREPTSEEQNLMGQYVAQHGLANLSRIIFNLSEFVYVD